MATPEFKYQPMFEHGKDTTEYYLLTKDYVSVSAPAADGASGGGPRRQGADAACTAGQGRTQRPR